MYNLPTTNHNSRTVILANGEFPSNPICLSILRNSEYLVCCDGAINSLSKTDIIPNAIVGDCDSLSEDNRVHFAHIIHRISEQDTNDLTKAVNFCIEQGKNKITILGATGKREDHTIANISLLCQYINHTEIEMITDYGIFTAITANAIFESYPKQQVSIFCMDPSPITTQNLKYAVSNRIFTSWWQGTLNESEKDEFRIDTKGRTIVYRAF